MDFDTLYRNNALVDDRSVLTTLLFLSGDRAIREAAADMRQYLHICAFHQIRKRYGSRRPD